MDRKKDGYGNDKYLCIRSHAVSVRVIQKKGDEKNTELKMESSDGLNMSEVSEREAS